MVTVRGLNDGTYEVVGVEVLPGLAVTRIPYVQDTTRYAWTLTHIRSGLCIGWHFDDPELAGWCAATLLAAVDWTQHGDTLNSDKAVKAAVAALAAYATKSRTATGNRSDLP